MSNTKCVNWAERLQRGQIPFNRAKLPMRTKKAKRFAAIFDRLRVGDLDGEPMTSELPNTSWVRDIGMAVWGGNTVKECLICCPKKQSKSTFGSLLFLAAFLAETKPRQTFTILAPSIGIAGITFAAIEAAIQADQTLSDLCHVRSYTREITNRDTGATLTVRAFEKSASTGLKGSVLLDESWLLGEKATGQKLRAQIRGALAASDTAKIVHLTTTSDDPPRGFWADLLSYARQVRDGEVMDPAFLPVIWEPWPDCPDPFEDESVWPKLMPSFPHIAAPEFYRSMIAEAKASGPAAIARDKAQFFNWTPETASAGADGWLVADMLPRLVERISIADLFAQSDVIAAGCDLGGLSDLSSLEFLGVKGDRWMVAARAWATPTVWQVNTSSASAFDDFVADGDLVRIEPGQDLDGILDLLEQARDTGKLTALGIDPAGAQQLTDHLAATPGFQIVADPDDLSGFGDVPILGVGQTALKLSPALRTIERQADQGLLRVSDARLMQWSFGNVRIGRHGAADHVDRSRQQDKIDVIAAILDAVSVYLVVPEPIAFDTACLMG